ncbi:MAG: HypC/HybG/HupF family hydrogenase formation chaperone [Promethearchaeota archaeon]
MCLAIPARIISIEEDKATVDFGGVTRVISLALLPDTVVGDYVLVHTGYAIQKVDREEAEKTLDLWNQILSTEGSTSP